MFYEYVFSLLNPACDVSDACLFSLLTRFRGTSTIGAYHRQVDGCNLLILILMRNPVQVH